MKSFVGKLPGLQKQQAALGLRESSTILRSLAWPVLTYRRRFDLLDIRLSEELAAVTHTDDFNKSLEIQQSEFSP